MLHCVNRLSRALSQWPDEGENASLGAFRSVKPSGLRPFAHGWNGEAHS
jgi:hypothetical protein